MTELPADRIQLEDAHFFVSGINLFHGTNEIYGPFPGLPHLTYEFLRDGNGNHIFKWFEEPGPHICDPTRPQDPDSPCHWADSEDTHVAFGWRRTYDTWTHAAPDGEPRQGSIGIPYGRWWSDLSVYVVARHITVPRDYNDYPRSEIRHR